MVTSTPTSTSPTELPLRFLNTQLGGSQPSEAVGPAELAGDIEGLKIEEDGRISFHGPTSLFQLPSGLGPDQRSPVVAEHGVDGRKERLINNAWRERAFEQLATIPVGITPPQRGMIMDALLTGWYRNRFNIYLTPTGAGSTRFSTLCTGLLLPVSSEDFALMSGPEC
jgi:hypothetical protein